MKRPVEWLAVPALLALAACGQGGGADMVETNSGSIVTNEAQVNQALESNNEQPNNLSAVPAG